MITNREIQLKQVPLQRSYFSGLHHEGGDNIYDHIIEDTSKSTNNTVNWHIMQTIYHCMHTQCLLLSYRLTLRNNSIIILKGTKDISILRVIQALHKIRTQICRVIYHKMIMLKCNHTVFKFKREGISACFFTLQTVYHLHAYA